MQKLSWALAGLSVLLTAGACFAVYVEGLPLARAESGPDGAFESLAAGAMTQGPSTYSKMAALNSCFTALTSIYGLAQPTPRRDTVVDACRQLAAAAVAAVPTLSFGWYIGAMTAAEAGDSQRFSDQYIASQQTGHDEEWIAELRVPLAEDHLAALDPAARAAEAADLALLAGSSRGIPVLARRYVADPAFRERVTAVFQQLPAGQQAQFLAEVQAESKDRPAGASPRE